MEPTSFGESNSVLEKPEGMKEEDCGPLSVYQDGKHIVSCWKMTAEELAEINRTKRIWIIAFGLMPPMKVVGAYPFATEANQNQERENT